GEYGNAFLTKHPILESDVIHIPDAPEGSGPYQEHRTLFRNVIDLSGTRLVVLCTHFGLCEAERRLAVQAALDQLARERDPVVLLGDLNMEPDDPCLSPLYGALSDTAERKPTPLTFPSGEPKAKIDYIFTDARQKHRDLATVDTQNSDHRPLLATIALEA
ncbi:MAG TPA: endonuclease/exonuclease/phosphatase family protein, partial [Clostridia bacterium]|nr:endonuclease/exonuclease/phosphatase family protein [Clostridia bacterium]